MKEYLINFSDLKGYCIKLVTKGELKSVEISRYGSNPKKIPRKKIVVNKLERKTQEFLPIDLK